MNIEIILSAISGYILFTYGLLKYKDPFAISSFLLWFIMDIIMLRNTLKANINADLITTYTICTFLFLVLLLKKQKFEWDKKIDTLIAIIAICLLSVSVIVQAKISVYAGAIALFLAGIPNLKKTLEVKHPPNRIIYTALCFSIGPLFSILNTYKNDSSLEEYAYPALSLIYWKILILILLWKKNKTLHM